MTEKDFLNYIDKQHKLRLSILSDPKKKRMAGTDDRLLNFKRMAGAMYCTEESAAANLMVKQFIDFLDMADESHPKFDDLDYFKELGADIQNYVDITLAIASEGE